jgi:hypothetical protein
MSSKRRERNAPGLRSGGKRRGEVAPPKEIDAADLQIAQSVEPPQRRPGLLAAAVVLEVAWLALLAALVALR